MAGNVIQLTDENFDEEVKAAEGAVLVDFWAEWCGPCKMIAPILEEIATEESGRIQVAKLNIDENLRTTQRFEVMSIPTLILFKDGEVRHRIVGAKGKGQLIQEIKAFL